MPARFLCIATIIYSDTLKYASLCEKFKKIAKKVLKLSEFVVQYIYKNTFKE